MKRILLLSVCVPLFAFADGGPQITIYNDGFATVKEDRVLSLEEGVSEIRVTDMSGQLEPDSVLLRELGEEPFHVRILEQSYVNDPLTEGLLLHQFEGQNVRFEEVRQDGSIKESVGKVIRSGYIPGGRNQQPIVEMGDAVRFSLPGRPVFDGIDSDAFLKPSLVWQIESEKEGACPIEVAYITAGMSWEATYSLVAPEEGADEYDFSGWISLQNSTGKDFENAQVKLIAGDVEKIQRESLRAPMNAKFAGAFMSMDQAMPQERSFDEFHLYTLPWEVTVRNNELKQVEFLRSSGVKGLRSYTYNPMVNVRYYDQPNTDPDYGVTADTKVGVRIEISNSETNGLGVALPKGRLRLYRTDEKDGRREFTGENQIDHLAKNEKLKLDMGYAFDLVGARRCVDYQLDTTGKRAVETIEVKLRNRKDVPVEIRVVEPMFRAISWRITNESMDYAKVDAHTIEFRVPVPADGETVVTYTVIYRW
ncbi:MAG: hypothetical protein LBN38_03035 [Verrucomicrobiota bacterium]|jgi:hypothetical protein|nr:hypothetical protein [Verrucomicrobiota bacterium]